MLNKGNRYKLDDEGMGEIDPEKEPLKDPLEEEEDEAEETDEKEEGII